MMATLKCSVNAELALWGRRIGLGSRMRKVRESNGVCSGVALPGLDLNAGTAFGDRPWNLHPNPLIQGAQVQGPSMESSSSSLKGPPKP